MTVIDRTPLIYVTIDDARAPVDITRSVLSFSVDEHERKATKISLSLDDPEGRFRERLTHGTVIAVRWGWPGSLSRPRGGIIHKADPSYDDMTLNVEAYGRELAMSTGAIRRVFRGQTLRESVETLARDSGLRVRWEAADTIRFDGSVVDNETAWAWVQRQSAALGLVVTVENGEVLVREPPLDRAPAHVLLWGWRGSNVLSFEIEENSKKSERENEGVVAVFVDPASGRQLQHAAGSPNVTRATLAHRRLEAARHAQDVADKAALNAYLREHPDLEDRPAAEVEAAWRASRDQRRRTSNPPTTDEPSLLSVFLNDGTVTAQTPPAPASPAAQEAQNGQQVSSSVAAPASAAREHGRRVAEGTYRAHERGKVKAKAVCEGMPTAQRNDLVRVLGTQQRDAGLWCVEGVRHTIGSDGYTTEFELKRDGVNAGRRAPVRPGKTAQQGSGNSSSGGGLLDALARILPINLNNESG